MVGVIRRLSRDLIQAVSHCFGEHSFLKHVLPDFIPRDAQKTLALEIAYAIQNKTILVAEAGTGLGKTFAYLIPSLLSRKKTVISTATKMLQDQLVNKDLPILMRAVGRGVRVQNLKGRANYICEYRVRSWSESASFVERQIVLQLIYIREQLPRLIEGVREELPDIQEDASVWPYATSTTENCLGGDCPCLKRCFLAKARKKALDAEIIVINHHLFFADLNLKETGFGSLLPGVEVMIFDEAHALPDIASDFFGARLSTRMLKEWIQEMEKINIGQEAILLQLQDLEKKMEILKTMGEEGKRLRFHELLSIPHFKAALEAIKIILTDLRDALNVCPHEGELKNLYQRLTHYLDWLTQCAMQDSTKLVWAEKFKFHWVFHITPLEVAKQFHAALLPQVSYVFTSATLAVGSSFEVFMSRLGLPHPKTLLLSSPFDYVAQALMYCPRGLPDVHDPMYYDYFIASILPLIEVYEGRSFLLFTSYEAMYQVAEKIQSVIPYPILVQGSESKAILLAKFRQSGHAVLLGTSSFWEGVDVKGETLSCVSIDKLPFMNPHDPITQGRLAYYAQQGRSGFEAYILPAAVIALKQGVGRLIRDQEDRGIVVIGDPRLTGRIYGKIFMESLPPFPKTRDLTKALAFAKNGRVKSA